MSIRRAATPVAAALMTVLAGCGVIGDSACVDEEADAFEKLHAVADATMQNVEATRSTYSRCEDEGQPGAAVIAEVIGWRSFNAAGEHLASVGWTRDDARNYVSPDDRYRAQIIMDVGTPKHPLVYFLLAD